ncbi:hypothetical protein OAO34_04800 [Candidatus Poseidoniaceae archaeon]|nr:hypothetical protein [Candidatus Poseidoniaceae archaeon]
MNGRRRKDEPFNPFAPNASQKARDRKDKVQRPTSRQRTPEPVKPTNDLAAKQKAAMEAMRKRKEIENEKQSSAKVVAPTSTPVHKPSPQPKPAPKTSIKKPENREDRLAALRAKSAATAQFAKDAKDAKKSEETPVAEVEILKENVTEVVTEVAVEEVIAAPVKTAEKKNPANVFKTIKTEKKKADRRPKRRRPGDKKGGGRQPQSRKLDRRKYLEYKYVARDLLDVEEVSEEHRSNVLGQIWAKGERIGVSEAIEFINQKEAELIIPERIADEFRKMVKKYTTKR